MFPPCVFCRKGGPRMWFHICPEVITNTNNCTHTGKCHDITNSDACSYTSRLHYLRLGRKHYLTQTKTTHYRPACGCKWFHVRDNFSSNNACTFSSYISLARKAAGWHHVHEQVVHKKIVNYATNLNLPGLSILRDEMFCYDFHHLSYGVYKM